MTGVAILGIAAAPLAERRDDASYMELTFEVVDELLRRTGWSHDAIDTFVNASSDFQDGRTISDVAVQDAAGAAHKSASKVSMDGLFALVYAAARIASGMHRTCLVTAHAKPSEGDPRAIARAAFDPIYQRPLGLDDHAALGLQARAFLHRTGLPRERLAEAAAQAARAARACDRACPHPAAAVEDVLASPPAADPLRACELAPERDGAVAVLLGDAETAAGRGVLAGWLRGFGLRTDAHQLGARDLGGPGVLPGASADAAARAGLDDLAAALDLVELHDASSAQALLWREALGLPAGGGPLVNPSGGALGGGQAGFATGLYRLAEVCERLEAGRLGLAHGMTGFTGQAHCVWIVEGA